MMELNDSSSDRLSEPRSGVKDENRSFLEIDLNEIPAAAAAGSSTGGQDTDADFEPVEVVRAIHDNPDPAPGAPAEVPGPDQAATCGACGRPESPDLVVVCDGCERGFHLGCVNGGVEAAPASDWICGDCVSSGVRSKLWPLGLKSKLLLDINASPPSDVEGDGNGDEEIPDLRKHMPASSSFLGNAFGNAMTYSSFLNPGRGYDNHKASGVTACNTKIGLKDLLGSHALESFQQLGFGFPLGSLVNSSTPFRIPSWNTSELLLQGLRNFITERHGVLEDGWHVELKHSLDSNDLCAVYCAPNGETFGSMREVACYLGLTANGNYSGMDAEIRNQSSPLQEGQRLAKRRKTSRLSINGFPEQKGSPATAQCRRFPFNGQIIYSSSLKSGTLLQAGESVSPGIGDFKFGRARNGFPIQFEDFYVLSLGQVDTRQSYHEVNNIYPIGYKSCWHDKITGSLFTCEVSDGGVSGPVFKVKRSSCSELSVPVGSTVLSCPKIEQFFLRNNQEGGDLIDNNREHDVEILLSDPCPPLGDDILSCLDNSRHGKAFDHLHGVVGSVRDIFSSPSSNNLEHGDEIGEIIVEEDSLSAAWKKVSEKVIDACSKIYNQNGTLKFFCKHDEKGTKINWDMMNDKDNSFLSSLSKFCCSFAPVDTTSEDMDKIEIATLADTLSRWLDQDRFGLDAEFVLEMIEHLPGADSCLKYRFLKNRNSVSVSATVGNGVLLVNAKGGEEAKEDAYGGFSHSCKRPRLNGGCGVRNGRPPPGRPLCLRLPPALVGDFLQVSEVFWRFHEVLGLEEPFTLEKLEDELINPQFDSLVLDKHGKEVNRSWINSRDLDCTARNTPPLSSENSSSSLQMGTKTREHCEAKLSDSSQGQCLDALLTRAHVSLLQVLICELQSMVAAFVDPNFDSGESRSRRGRKKDDTSLSAKRNKLHMLPVNELTWPELARRYILSFLSMDGNLESAEIAARESGKVFRCLQGDGGLLCGSLTGVAGMEADAMLLAEATKKVFGSLKRENAVLSVEEGDSGAPETNTCNGDMPEWAQILEPVKKLPTNVGTRIRKCVYEALEKNPPDWAKKILEHSISKEIYKGNASGPTKKAVLSLLADVRGGDLEQKTVKATKKRSIIDVSDVIMKKCRVVLRDVATADDDKVFCTLLGRKLLNSSDNDDEGLLGSPAMVSRPLDFRTIDLRLATGSYGGSHEAFLEDVRELWSNIRAMYVDQPDCVELAETLSQKFESLCEAEVLPLVQKLMDYTKSECLSAEMKKEIKDLVASTNKLPKAPWDEGVCKVCGVDKDDDSVLLCDTCDAEYHTYCLNPPLIRIPEGNWYCPSCVIAKRMAEDALESYKLIRRRKGRKYQGEVTRIYLETTGRLAAVMEEKDYWEFSAEERILLLKLLCDELLSSVLVHQHLEQCAEAIVELQQKLRSLSSEWRNMKFREEFLSAKLAKVNPSILKELVEPQKSSGSADHLGSDSRPRDGIGSRATLDDLSEHSSATLSNNNGGKPALDTSTQPEDACSISGESKILPLKKDTAPSSCELPMPVHKSVGKNQEEPSLPSNSVELHTCHDASSLASEEVQACQLELNTINNDILHLQKSMTSIESQLLKQSIRRDFLGCDSGDRLYWLSCLPDGHPHIFVDESVSVQKSLSLHSHTDLIGSKAPSPFLSGVDHGRVMRSPWTYYETDTEIEELVQWLKDDDPKERDLKEAIMCWKRLRFQEPQNERSKPENSLSQVSPAPLVTKAAMSLVKRYGPCFKLENETVRKRGKKTKFAEREKLYRCECLEPVLPSMIHCLICHKTFSSDGEFEEHSDGRCIAAPLVNKGEEVPDSSKGKGNVKSNCLNSKSSAGNDLVEVPNDSELGSGLIRYQDEESISPYHFEEICAKFVTKDSNRDLVKEIGLIGSNGIPKLIPSSSVYVKESMLISVTSKEQDGDSSDQLVPTDRMSLLHGNTKANGEGLYCESDVSLGSDFGCVAKPNGPVGYGLSERKNQRSSGNHYEPDGVKGCCVVPQTSLRPVGGKGSSIFRLLRKNLLEMDAALPEHSLRPSKAHLDHRWAWRAFVKSAKSIYELVQATIVLEDMIRTEYLRNEWWYWSSLSAAAKTSTLSALSLRIYALDAAILYDKTTSESNPNEETKPTSLTDQKPQPSSETQEKGKGSRRSGKKRKEAEG
ncbi:PREDICTED: methyl-CpG-binding domain-containing protein 9 [Tarenaya hassleriana]|uniref:methyl-CpG-binding domain-containing protein 9 n=1 Tax=Tarenaya hassleriana TaxID=28532 RepID=UPI00053C6A23|nr:PREDICTED: methyl-CpG-binding domain-containing protein 9 [Tarenaya hassleriana]